MPDTRTILSDTETLKLPYVCASGESIALNARTTSAEVVDQYASHSPEGFIHAISERRPICLGKAFA